MNSEFHHDPNFTAWGPFVHDDYYIAPINPRTVIIGGTIFAASGIFTLTAAYLGTTQTRAIRRPWRSSYVRMIWLELAACVIISIECLLYILKIIRPSFYFYMSLLLLWAIQVQLLLQIIINRIRVILHDREKGKWIMISVAIIVTLITISVFCIWIPARLQISQRFIHVNEIWDRIEKVLYLMIDATLNWYFIRVVKENLVRNGLQKYNRLVRVNQRLIVISLLMDVMIIAAMSIPNGFIYAMFHPLAYLVKLNIELIMSNLIKKIAIATSHNEDFVYEFGIASLASDSSPPVKRRSTLNPFSRLKKNEIRKTEEYSVHSVLKSDMELKVKSTDDQIRRASIGAGVNVTSVVGDASSPPLDSSKSVRDTDARSWYEGDDIITAASRNSKDTRHSGRTGEYEIAESIDEEAGLVKLEPVYLSR